MTQQTYFDLSAIDCSIKNVFRVFYYRAFELQETDEKMCFDLMDFRVHCKCTECLQYREMLILLILEDHEYNTLWDRLRSLIREFYDVIPQ